jgi:hypothetical protein
MESVGAKRIANDLGAFLLGLVMAWLVVSQVWVSSETSAPMWVTATATVGLGVLVAWRYRALAGLGVGLAVSALLCGVAFGLLLRSPAIS